jgi:serine/threonine protein kinase
MPTTSETVTMTQPGTVIGTVSYMSPEQARGVSNLGPQSDQFSLGIVLFELAAHKRPFQRETAAETMVAIMREEPPPMSQSVPAPLRWIIERLLAKEPDERYDSTRDKLVNGYVDPFWFSFAGTRYEPCHFEAHSLKTEQMGRGQRLVVRFFGTKAAGKNG